MQKMAHNERVKLTATFLNNIAVGLIVGGCFIPFINSMSGDRLFTSTIVIGFFLAEALGGGLHFVARWHLRLMID